MKGYVYILSNPSMPGIVKIGRTTRTVHGRAGELYQTGVPTPFVVEHYLATPDCVDLERRMHVLFAGQRVGQDREFFAVDPAYAKQCMVDYLREQIDEIVDLYLPGQMAVEIDCVPDSGDFALLCHDAGVDREAFIHAFRFLDHAAVRAAIDQRAKRRASWAATAQSDSSGGLLN